MVGSFLSKTRLASHHLRSCVGKLLQANYVDIHPQQLKGNLYLFCDKVCESAADLKRSRKVYRNKINYKTIDESFVCHICRKACRSEVSPLTRLHACSHSIQNWSNGPLLLKSGNHYMCVSTENASDTGKTRRPLNRANFKL